MKFAPIPHNELERLQAVNSLGVYGCDVQERLDRISRITHSVFNVSCTFISLVAEERVQILSKQESTLIDVPRDISFCGHTIGSRVTRNIESRMLEVKDTLNDVRFCDNPYVKGRTSGRTCVDQRF